MKGEKFKTKQQTKRSQYNKTKQNLQIHNKNNNISYSKLILNDPLFSFLPKLFSSEGVMVLFSFCCFEVDNFLLFVLNTTKKSKGRRIKYTIRRPTF